MKLRMSMMFSAGIKRRRVIGQRRRRKFKKEFVQRGQNKRILINQNSWLTNYCNWLASWPAKLT